MRYLPATCSLRELEAFLRKGASPRSDDILVALFHAYDFQEVGGPGAQLTLAGLQRVVDWARSASLIPATLEGLLRGGHDLGAGRYECHRELRELDRLVPIARFSYRQSVGPRYLAATRAHEALRTRRRALFLGSALVAAGSFSVAASCLRVARTGAWLDPLVLRGGLGLAGGLLIGIAFVRGEKLTWRRALAIWVGLGLLAGQLVPLVTDVLLH